MYVCLEEDPPWKVCVLSVRTIHPIHFCRQPRPEFGVKFCLSNSRIFWLMKIKNILYMLGKSYKCLFGRKTVPLWRWEGGGTLWGGVWPWGRSSARNTQIVTFLLWPTKANMYRMLQVLTDRNLSKLKPAWTSTLFQKARICFINSA